MERTLQQSVVFSQLEATSVKAVLGQALFAAVALLAPTITHRLGLDYKIAQPMHWMILFAGLTYGPVSGLAIGLMVPVLSSLISGMPLPAVLPFMMAELAVYGALSGLLKKYVSAFGAVAVALVAGRALYLLLIMALGRLQGSPGGYIVATWGPGVVAMLLQVALLPLLAGLYVKAVDD